MAGLSCAKLPRGSIGAVQQVVHFSRVFRAGINIFWHDISAVSGMMKV